MTRQSFFQFVLALVMVANAEFKQMPPTFLFCPLLETATSIEALDCQWFGFNTRKHLSQPLARNHSYF